MENAPKCTKAKKRRKNSPGSVPNIIPRGCARFIVVLKSRYLLTYVHNFRGHENTRTDSNRGGKNSRRGQRTRESFPAFSFRSMASEMWNNGRRRDLVERTDGEKKEREKEEREERESSARTFALFPRGNSGLLQNERALAGRMRGLCPKKEWGGQEVNSCTEISLLLPFSFGRKVFFAKEKGEKRSSKREKNGKILFSGSNTVSGLSPSQFPTSNCGVSIHARSLAIAKIT